MADINYLIEFQTETGEVTAAGREVERLSSNLQNIRTGPEGLNDLNQLIHAIEQAILLVYEPNLHSCQIPSVRCH